MTWLLPSIIASLCATTSLTLVFAFFYHQYRERHLGFWTLGWGIHSLRYQLDLSMALGWLSTDSSYLIQSCVLASGLLILRGTEEMARKKMNPAWWIGGVFCAGWILLGQVSDLPFLPQTLPAFLFYALVSIRTGKLFLSLDSPKQLGKILTGWGFILWGLHRAIYPFVHDLEWLPPWRFLMAALLALTVAFGMIMLYFARLRSNLAASEERFRSLVEQATDGMFLLDLNGRILDINRHACLSLGYSRDQLLTLGLQDVVQGLTQIVLPQGPKRFVPGVPTTLDGQHRRNDGSTFPVDIRLSVIESPHGELQLLALARDMTKQKETEEQLRQSMRKFKALFNQAFELVALLSPSGTLLDANETALRIIGRSNLEVVGIPFWETPWWSHDPEQHSLLRRAIERAAQGELVRMEVSNRTLDGQLLMMDCSLKPIHDERGQVSLLIVEGRDITERIRFERNLAAINIKLEALIDASPMPIIAVDRRARITEWNRAAEQVFGWTRESVLNLPDPMVPASEAERDKNLQQRIFSGEKIQGLELLRQCKNGSTISLELFAAPLHDVTGAIDGAMSIFVDRREQKMAEVALRHSEIQYRKLYQQFETLFNGIPDPITLIDREMKIIWANRGAAKAFGRDQNEVTGKFCYRFWHGKDNVCSECPVIDCFISGEFQEKKIDTPDGRIWGVKVFPIRDKDGQIVNALELASEITEKLRLREEANRTSRLASLGELAAGVAHEINNPNGLILLNLPMLSEAFADLEAALAPYAEAHPDFTVGGLPFARMRREIPELLDEMRDGATRIKRIVEDLKNFVRPDNLSASHEVDLNQALQAAVRLAAGEIRKSTDLFSVSYDEGIPPVTGISQRIEQVLVNLIINACQSLPDKSRGLTVRTRFDRDSAMNLVEVVDQGRGIEEKHLRHVTDPFFTTRRNAGGTGLGLSVSARIVKEHGGELRFASVLGEGTTVTLLLPPRVKDKR